MREVPQAMGIAVLIKYPDDPIIVNPHNRAIRQSKDDVPILIRAKGKLFQIEICRNIVPGGTVAGSIAGIRGCPVQQISGE